MWLRSPAVDCSLLVGYGLRKSAIISEPCGVVLIGAREGERVLKPGQEWEKSDESFVAAPQPTPEVPGLIGPDRCDQHEAQGDGPATVTGALATPNDLSPTAFPPGLRDPSTDSHGLKSIGPYQLVKRIGEGGMGEVWLAEQTAPVRRQVALKLIRAGMCNGSRPLRL